MHDPEYKSEPDNSQARTAVPSHDGRASIMASKMRTSLAVFFLLAAIHPLAIGAEEMTIECEKLDLQKVLAPRKQTSYRSCTSESSGETREIEIKLSCDLAGNEKQTRWRSSEDTEEASSGIASVEPSNSNLVIKLTDADAQALRKIEVSLRWDNLNLLGSSPRCLHDRWTTLLAFNNNELEEQHKLLISANIDNSYRASNLITSNAAGWCLVNHHSTKPTYKHVAQTVLKKFKRSIEIIIKNAASGISSPGLETALACFPELSSPADPQPPPRITPSESPPIVVDDIRFQPQHQGAGDFFEIKTKSGASHTIALLCLLPKILSDNTSDPVAATCAGKKYLIPKDKLKPINIFGYLRGFNESVYYQPWRFCNDPLTQDHRHEDHNDPVEGSTGSIGRVGTLDVQLDDKSFVVSFVTNLSSAEILYEVYIPGDSTTDSRLHIFYHIKNLTADQIENCVPSTFRLMDKSKTNAVPGSSVVLPSNKELRRRRLEPDPARLLVSLQIPWQDVIDGGNHGYEISCIPKLLDSSPSQSKPVSMQRSHLEDVEDTTADTNQHEVTPEPAESEYLDVDVKTYPPKDSTWHVDHGDQSFDDQISVQDGRLKFILPRDIKRRSRREDGATFKIYNTSLNIEIHLTSRLRTISFIRGLFLPEIEIEETTATIQKAIVSSNSEEGTTISLPEPAPGPAHNLPVIINDAKIRPFDMVLLILLTSTLLVPALRLRNATSIRLKTPRRTSGSGSQKSPTKPPIIRPGLTAIDRQEQTRPHSKEVISTEASANTDHNIAKLRQELDYRTRATEATKKSKQSNHLEPISDKPAESRERDSASTSTVKADRTPSLLPLSDLKSHEIRRESVPHAGFDSEAYSLPFLDVDTEKKTEASDEVTSESSDDAILRSLKPDESESENERRARILHKIRSMSRSRRDASQPLFSSSEEQFEHTWKFWLCLKDELYEYFNILDRVSTSSENEVIEFLNQAVEPSSSRDRLHMESASDLPLRIAISTLLEEMIDPLECLDQLCTAWKENLEFELDMLGTGGVTSDLEGLADERNQEKWRSQLACFLFKNCIDRMPSLYSFHQLVTRGIAREFPNLSLPGWSRTIRNLESSLREITKNLRNVGIVPLDLELYVDITAYDDDKYKPNLHPRELAGGPIKDRIVALELPEGTIVRYRGWAFRDSFARKFLRKDLSVWILRYRTRRP